MKKSLKYASPILTLLGLTIGGCQVDIPEPEGSGAGGGADFSRYIAVGNSLTAGYADNGLYLAGQQSSYPSLLARQFEQVGGGSFTQPLFDAANAAGSGYLQLKGFDATGNPILGPEAAAAPGQFATGRAYVSASLPLLVRYKGTDNQNLGVPGIRMSDINTASYGQLTAQSNSSNFNPYFERLLSGTDSRTYLSYVQERVATVKPTFFTEWLGNNDVLGYATAGAASSSLTPVATFTTNTNQVLDALSAGGTKGLVATIPDVTGIPFFTTVGPRFKATLTAKNVPGMFIITGAKPGTATPPAGTPNNRRQITTADIRDASGGRQLFTLTSSPFLSLFNLPTGAPWRYLYGLSGQPKAGFPLFLNAFGIDTTATFGTSALNPIPSAFVLDDLEQTEVANATNSFNSVLVAAADSRNLAVFDANGFFSNIARNGLVVNGVSNSAAFVTGNLFSLDGVHPTPRGYAVIANEMIKAINYKYGSNVPGIDATRYPGVTFP
jgi:lysophospholipase L1-like esterase